MRRNTNYLTTLHPKAIAITTLSTLHFNVIAITTVSTSSSPYTPTTPLSRPTDGSIRPTSLSPDPPPSLPAPPIWLSIPSSFLILLGFAAAVVLYFANFPPKPPPKFRYRQTFYLRRPREGRYYYERLGRRKLYEFASWVRGLVNHGTGWVVAGAEVAVAPVTAAASRAWGWSWGHGRDYVAVRERRGVGDDGLRRGGEGVRGYPCGDAYEAPDCEGEELEELRAREAQEQVEDVVAPTSEHDMVSSRSITSSVMMDLQLEQEREQDRSLPSLADEVSSVNTRALENYGGMLTPEDSDGTDSMSSTSAGSRIWFDDSEEEDEDEEGWWLLKRVEKGVDDVVELVGRLAHEDEAPWGVKDPEEGLLFGVGDWEKEKGRG